MRAIRLTHFGAPLCEQQLPDPTPAPGEVVVDVRAAGICHSDAHYRAGRARVNLPLTLGHEIAGVISAVGSGAPWRAGDRVAVHYLVSCGKCDGCKRGEQFCERGEMFGKERDGGYAERVLIPARNAVPIPDEVPFEHAAVMMCSTATAYHALRLANVGARDDVAILGFGGLGVSALELARVLGARDVFAVDVVPEKLRLAKSLGALARESFDGLAVDVVLDFAGHPAACTAALRALRPGGRLMLVALNATPFEFDPYRDVLAKERRIIGCSDHTLEELHELMGFARGGEIDLSRAITRTVARDASAITDVLDELERGTTQLRTVVTA